MSAEPYFKIEDLFRFPRASGKYNFNEDYNSQVTVRGKDLIEEFSSKLRELKQVKLVLEEEVKKTLSLKSTLHDEDNALTAEVLKLQGILNEKEETCGFLQYKCEDLEQKSQKQLDLKKQKEELIIQYSSQIQETKLKHRKIRMKFENELQQLIGQHKNLYTMFTLERLPALVQFAEYTSEQLLKAEKQKVEQVAKLQEELSNAQNTLCTWMM